MPSKDLKVALMQIPLVWEQKEANLQKVTYWLQQKEKDAFLVILPEMFSTGFSMNAASLAENMDGFTVQWMREKAALHRCILSGSLIIEEEGRYYNRLLWVQPDGVVHYYNKRHLFAFAKEDESFCPGNQRVLVQVNGWTILLQVCYDLRFPVWSRQQNPYYDALLYVANWPERRSHAWKTLLQARAIENQSYVIGVNRIGNDGHDIYYSGDSLCIDPMGQIILDPVSAEGIFYQSLQATLLNEVRAKYPFLKDADKFYLP